jgi:hypothetical protein
MARKKKRDNLMPMYKGLPDFVAKNEKREDYYKVNEDKLAPGLLILEEIDPGLVSRIPEAMRMLKKVKAR